MKNRLIESICVIDGQIRNLAYHQQRLNEARLQLLKIDSELNLAKEFSKLEPFSKGKFKLRIIYSAEIEHIEILPYTTRKINSFELIESETIDYSFKKENRFIFEVLKKQSVADEIIITKNGSLTDTSYANLVFKQGENWFTPDTPLLKGTMRQSLLDQLKITAIRINQNDLKTFEGFKMINAMMNLAESPFYPIKKIINLQ